MSFQISSNYGNRGRDDDAREYHGVIVYYNYNSGLGVIEFLDDNETGAAKRRVSFRREYVLVGLDYTLNVGEEVMFNIDRESRNARLKNIIPVGLEERVRDRFKQKALEANVLVSERLAKLRRRK